MYVISNRIIPRIYVQGVPGVYYSRPSNVNNLNNIILLVTILYIRSHELLQKNKVWAWGKICHGHQSQSPLWHLLNQNEGENRESECSLNRRNGDPALVAYDSVSRFPESHCQSQVLEGDSINFEESTSSYSTCVGLKTF